jgi:hypothetical protein
MMMQRCIWRSVLVLLVAVQGVAVAQTPAVQRPNLGPVVPPLNYQHALQKGTRTAEGAPGPRYWINAATYKITARIQPDTKRLEGSVTITYKNNSPDTLHNLHLDVTQNYHRATSIRSEAVSEITEGMELKRVAVNGTELKTDLEAGPRYVVADTRLVLVPATPLLPGQSVNIAIDYAFTIPQAGIGERMGWSKDNLFFIAYWYPQMAVYDDVVGWHPDPFTGTTEFYADFANYDYTIDMPEGWVLVGTGELANAQQVLSADVYQRLQKAASSDQVVSVIGRDNMSTATTKGVNGRLQWHFTAENVRDVAFSASRASNWDAVRTPVGDRNGDGKTDYARADAIWRESAPVWKNSARYTAHSISFHSQRTGLPYPYSHMTAVEGEDIMDGGMEFPMMTLIGAYTEGGDPALYATTAHEESHMWFPMIVSSDERRYSWMDEGTTQFNENQAEKDFYHAPDARYDIEDQEGYLNVARAGEEGEIMRRSQYHYSPWAYGVASYDKPATVLVALRGVLGDSVFAKGYREYVQRWKYKHPYPWDMWNTYESVSGKDLDWFWQEWYNTTWTFDQAVTNVANTNAGSVIVVENRSNVVMPATLTITRADGTITTRTIPVETWLSGQQSASVTLTGASPVTHVEIDAARAFPDIDRSNNVWPK